MCDDQATLNRVIDVNQPSSDCVERFRMAFANAPQPTVVLDRLGGHVYGNAASFVLLDVRMRLTAGEDTSSARSTQGAAW